MMLQETNTCMSASDVSYSDFITAFLDQARNPPGGDTCIGACYQAVTNLAQRNRRMIQLFDDILSIRSLTPYHFTSLFFRAVQFMKLRAGISNYPHEYMEVQQWETDLQNTLDNDQELAVLRQILLKRDTSTTKYQRYAGPAIIMSALFPQQPLRMIDIGCGGNYGLPGLALKEPFEPILDHTPGQMATGFLDKLPFLEEGIAIDRENPYEREIIQWRHACSFYPVKELHQLKTIRLWEQRLATTAHVQFQQLDLLHMYPEQVSSILASNEFDVVILSTILYQMSAEEQYTILSVARNAIKPDGIIIIQDFARKSTDTFCDLAFDVSWGVSFSYRTFVLGAITGWEIAEVLQWSNGRCLEVRAGEHFEFFAKTRFQKG